MNGTESWDRVTHSRMTSAHCSLLFQDAKNCIYGYLKSYQIVKERTQIAQFPIYVDNNSAPTIASNLLETNAVLSWQASGQRAKRFRSLLCTTISHVPPVMRDNACYRRHTMQQSGGRAHTQERL